MINIKEKFESILEKTKARYDGIRGLNIQLRLCREPFFTMRASIALSSIFSKKRKYLIYINWAKRDFLSQLSEDDLVGWFGHELAHIIDYETMSNLGLALFALKYVFNPKFRFSVERRINAFAFNGGFADELVGMSRKFLSSDNISKKYKEYIIKNCLPDWESIKHTAIRHGISKDSFEFFKWMGIN